MEYYLTIKRDEVLTHAISWTLKILYYVKEARHKRLHSEWLHLIKYTEQANL